MSEQSAILPTKLVFKSGSDFFEYQCEFGQTDIQPKRGIVALVVDAREFAGAASAIARNDDGTEIATILVASSDGGFLAVANTASAGPPLAVDDVVIWVPLERTTNERLAKLDERMCWTGLIAAKLAPEIDTSQSSFEILHRFA